MSGTRQTHRMIPPPPIGSRLFLADVAVCSLPYTHTHLPLSPPEASPLSPHPPAHQPPSLREDAVAPGHVGANAGHIRALPRRGRSPLAPRREDGGDFHREDARLRGKACGLRRSLSGHSPADRSLPPSPPAQTEVWKVGGLEAWSRTRQPSAAAPTSISRYLPETQPPSLRQDAVAPGHVGANAGHIRALPRRAPRLPGDFHREDARLRGKACGLRRSLCGHSPADRSLPPSPPAQTEVWKVGGLETWSRTRQPSAAAPTSISRYLSETQPPSLRDLAADPLSVGG